MLYSYELETLVIYLQDQFQETSIQVLQIYLDFHFWQIL